MEHSNKILRVALAGNPNAGKTSLFNALTGLHHHVGNYPGVTVEQKSGHFHHVYHPRREEDGPALVHSVEITDLPGAYSLNPYSIEERIARDEVLFGDYDVVAVVVDSTNLRRHLSLLAQVALAGRRAVLCLNMSDEAKAQGQRLDLAQLRKLLGIPVIETVGHRAYGVPELKDALFEAAASTDGVPRVLLGDALEAALGRLAGRLRGVDIAPLTPRWLALKMLEQEPHAEFFLAERLTLPAMTDLKAAAKRERGGLEHAHHMDIHTFIAGQYAGFVNGLAQEVVLGEIRPDARALSDRLDAVLCHRVAGPFIFLGMMFLLFAATFYLGEFPMRWIEAGTKALAEFINGFWAPGSDSPLRSLLVDGIIAGVGGVIVFLPNILLLFLGLALLEDTGYMARAAFLVDKLMHKAGLHGKSFIPMVTGFGCSVPGIMATRILDNERDRLTTMLVLPLMSCGARLPIWMLLIPAFFAPVWRAPMLWTLYLFGILLAAVLARVLRTTLLAGEDAPFVMELPPYRRPTTRALVRKMGERGWLYLRKAGTIILGVSILLWVLASYPKPDPAELAAVHGTEARQAIELDHSVAGHIGHFIEPLLTPFGSDWRVGTALVGAFAAKEVFVSQMSIVFSLGDEADETTDALRDKLARTYSPLSAFALMIFLLIAAPCMATVAVMRRESGQWKWALMQFFGLTALGWILAVVAFQVGRLWV